MATRTALTSVYQWGVIALSVAMLFTGGYTVWKVITGYRDHRDTLAIFGKNIRHEADVHHWRYDVVSAKDEGLLLYLRKTHFVEPADAIAEWNTGSLDALVVSKEKAAVLVRDLKGATATQLHSNEREEQQWGGGYVLITR